MFTSTAVFPLQDLCRKVQLFLCGQPDNNDDESYPMVYLFRRVLFLNFLTEEVCPIPMDTTFVIDSSVCDDSSNWNRLLYFIQTLVTYFNVSPSGGRIALIQFSTGANVVLKFNTLTGSLLNNTEVNRRVGLLQCQGGFRRIDKALDLVEKEVLTPAGGVRDISKVCYF